MKTLLVCKSIHHSNTLKVSEVMAEEINADILPPEKVDMSVLESYNLIGIGSGIYFGKHHRSLFDFVKNIDSFAGKKVFVYYTSGFVKFPLRDDFESSLTAALEEKGAEILQSFSCRGWHTYGPFRIGGGKNKGHPTSDDLESARKFAKSLVDALNST